ncbi:Z1 domain-containing protein [Streptomyces sp. 4N509B]|uniref:Z1 domain-containing protein n=1 Tax=Streptomyces sp. 4N509B TaxID=3457413 RepID=UPI003FD33FCF
MHMDDDQPTPEELRQTIDDLLGILSAKGAHVDRELLEKEVTQLLSVSQDAATGPNNDDGGHRAWLAEAKTDRPWDFWKRYRWYLDDVRALPRAVVRRLDQSTDDVLGQLEDPQRPGPWRRTGLVIGQVQSGKTGHYIGLAAKAVDAGYRLIVVLAGIHNDLRSQTQLRMDEGLLGFHTDEKKRFSRSGQSPVIGAARMPGGRRLDIGTATNSSQNGDFGRSTANTMRNLPGLGHFPLVLVIKKHHKILDYVRQWVTEAKGLTDEHGQRVVRDFPLFVIDDEADNASINTADPDADPTRINAAIRELLNSFDKAAYVGYTATPFANIYIDRDARHEKFGADLFPDSFVRSLPSPSNYLGPERVFGLQTEDSDEEDIEPLPLVRNVTDHDSWLPTKHEANDEPSEILPDSLREAVMAFVLACAARRARGQKQEHNSMLVHVTRFIKVQNRVHEQLQDFVDFLLDSLNDSYGQSRQRLYEFRKLWERDFVPTTHRFPADRAERVTWQDVARQLTPALKKIHVRPVNGSSRDALDYYENRRTGYSVIAVGGQKLSRGLTLEGLTVSYYLRPSGTYDSLLQMGRWFGYRPGYEDLCRLYTTPGLQLRYVEVTAALDELRREIEDMADQQLSPEVFGLKVRASASRGLLVTAANKMRSGTRVLLSFSGAGPESVLYDLAPEIRENNVSALRDLVQQLDAITTPDYVGSNVKWNGIPPEVVSDFLHRYQSRQKAKTARPGLIADYIDKCTQAGELRNWTVCVVGKTGAESTEKVGRHTIGLVERSPVNKDEYEQQGRYVLRRVLSPLDEEIDLDQQQKDAAYEATRKAWEAKERKSEPKRASGRHLRLQRRADQALLLIYLFEPRERDRLPTTIDVRPPLVGFKLSFPRSEHRAATEYVANGVWLDEHLGLDDEEDDEE